MAYSTKEQVADEFVGVTFSSTTKVTDAQVDRWIDEADAVINMFVGKRYTTPVGVASPESLLVLQKISIQFVACRVALKLQVKTPDLQPNQGGRPVDPKVWATKILEKIAKGQLDLSDAELAHSTDGVRSFNSDNGIEQFFKRGVDQW